MTNERATYLLQNYGLNQEQGIRADNLFDGPMNAYPGPLQKIIREAGKRYGHSGDVIWECIVAFVKGQTLDEYLNDSGSAVPHDE